MREIMERYEQAGISLIPSCWMALWRTGEGRDGVIQTLREAGIGARSFWKPLLSS